jgi:nucleoid DNA-binding protein
MRKRQCWALTALLATLGVTLGLAAPVRSQRPQQPEPLTLAGRVAAATKMEEKDVEKMLKALGGAVRSQLTGGQSVELPGLGTLRVVRIAAHRDLVDGRPAVIPESNYVEFLPFGDLVGAANAPGAVPASNVLPFEYNPLPGQVKGLRNPGVRQPNVRER